MDSVIQFLTVLFLFVFVLFITWYTTRWIAKIQKGQNGISKGRNLEFIEGMSLGNGKFVQIVRAGDKYIVIGNGKDELNVLATLDADELNFEKVTDNSDNGFASVFERVKKLGDRKDKINEENN